MPQERLDDAEAQLAMSRASLTAAAARLAVTQDRLTRARCNHPSMEWLKPVMYRSGTLLPSANR